FRSRWNFFSSLNYTLQKTERQFRGFDGGGFGDPRVTEWAAGPNDARHVAVLTAGLSTPAIGTGTMVAPPQSGLPFTPIVQGDINGDGRFGDRAFVPDPAAAATGPALAAQLNALLASGSASARDCLRAFLGKVVDRNGCRGPWTQSLN